MIQRELSSNDLDWFAARLSLAVYDTKRETYEMLLHDMREALKDIPGYEGLTIEYEPNGHQRLTIDGKVLEVGPAASNAEIVLALKNSLVRTENTKVLKVTTPLDRLKGKFVQARGVAHRVATNMEAEADSLIAQEDAMKAKTTNAFAPHKAILAEASSELKAIEDALNLMTNGGPALDPLHDAGVTDVGSKSA